MGLTGGVGSGKSTVAAMLAARGAFVIDADAIAREVVAPGSEGLEALVAAFGTGVLAEDGSLDRPALAALAFRDEQAREQLNAITHPRIAARTAELMAGAALGQVLVHDVPLLVELALMPAYDVVVVVDASDATRIRRLESRGMSRDEAERRMAAQATREERLAAADVVVDNEGDLEDLGRQVDQLWAKLSVAGPRG